MAVKKKEVSLYGSDGNIIEKSTPDLDPSFLKSWFTLNGGGSSDIVKKIIKEPYANHSWVYATVSAIAGNISRLKPVLKDKNDPEALIFDHPVLDLYDNPNPLMTGAEFREAVLLNLLLPTAETPGGQCFIIPTDEKGNAVELIRGEIPTFLYPFSDVSIKPVIHEHVFKGWNYVHPSGHKIFYFNDQLIRMRLFNPYDWMLGLSPLSSLWSNVLNDAKSLELSDKILDNSANVGGLLTTDARLNPRQGADLKKMWQEQYEGLAKAGKTALLHSGLKYENTSKTLVDLQFIDQKKMNRETIMAVYGVGKTILGLTDGVNRATAKVEKELFWEDTLIPYINKFWDGFNTQQIKFLDKKNLVGDSDMRHVEALKRDQAGKIKSAHTLISDGVPPVDAFETVDLSVPTKKSEWLKEPLVTKPRVNLRTGEIIGAPTAPEESTEEKKIEVERKLYIKDNDADRKLWNTIQSKTIVKPMNKFKTAIVKYFVQQRNKMQDQVDVWLKKQNEDNVVTGVKTVVTTKAVVKVKDFLIPLDKQDELLTKTATPIYKEAISLQETQMADELAGTVNALSKANVDKIVKNRIKELKKINTTSFKKIEKGVFKATQDAIDNNLTMNELAKNIKALESGVYQVRINQARSIARTELSGVASTTRTVIMKEEGIEFHRWVTAGDTEVRSTHAADGRAGSVKIGDPFPNTGLLYPHDPGGSAEEVVNCRCITRAVIKK